MKKRSFFLQIGKENLKRERFVNLLFPMPMERQGIIHE